jgi:hypothetical protein
MKMSELLEEKVEMCPKACCGVPVTECSCGPDCPHCDCYNKKKAMKEEATAGATVAGNIATVSSVPGAKRKVKKTGRYGAPTAPQATNSDGTAKNALDIKTNVMGGKTIKR